MIPHKLLGVISYPKNYRKIQRQSYISQRPQKYLYATPTHKNTIKSTVEILKMLSMMSTYKKYSSADNNLEVLYAAYWQKKRTCHTETSPFHIYINLSRGLIFSFAPALSSISTAISRLNASSSSDALLRNKFNDFVPLK